MVNKKFVSKVDEKLKAAEARRAELERAKAEEQQKKLAMRRDRMKKADTEIDENSTANANESLPKAPPIESRQNVKSFKYLRVKGSSGSLIKLNWERGRSVKRCRGVKLFTIQTVEALIKEGHFEMAQVLLGIMKQSVEARHPIQNKFAFLHGRIVEIKEKNKRAFTHESALNFTGSISPVRLPEFEADLNQLSRISSPIGMEELSRKYEGSIDMEAVECHVRVPRTPTIHYSLSNEFPIDDGMMDHLVTISKTPSKSPRKTQPETDQNNFPTVISPMKRPHKEIEAETVYTPQRKSARRLDCNEMLYDDEQVSEILLNDPNAAFISNPYIPATTGGKKQQLFTKKEERDDQDGEEHEQD